MRGIANKANILSLSPLVAAAASYAINVLAARGMASAVDYSQYLELQSWATYLGAIYTLCLVDLKLSPNGHQYKIFKLYGMAMGSAVFCLCLALLFSLAFHSTFYLAAALAGFSYAIFRAFLTVGLILRIPTIPIVMRLIRATVLVVMGAAAASEVLFEASPLHFMAIQGVAATLPLLIYWSRIFRIGFSALKTTMQKVFKNERRRLFRRNLSYVVDMIHTPLFYTATAGIAANGDLKKIVYVIGLLMPAAFIFSETIGERFRLRLGLASFQELKARCHVAKRAIFSLVLFYRFIFVASCVVTALAYLDLLEPLYAIVITLIAHVLFICASSPPGLVLKRGGMERIDLWINIVISLLLSVMLLTNTYVIRKAVLASLIICFKYFVQQTVAYIKLSRQ